MTMGALIRAATGQKERHEPERQSLEERTSTAEGRADAAEGKLARVEAAAAKGLPLEFADRLQARAKRNWKRTPIGWGGSSRRGRRSETPTPAKARRSR
jgi:hypothetical protein